MDDLRFLDPLELVNRAAFNERFEKLNSALFKGGDGAVDIGGNPVGVRIVTGSYVGTGAYGSSNPTNLVIPFPAKLVAITSKDDNYYYGLFVYGATSVQTIHGSNAGTATVSWNGTYISFYGDGAATQLNNQGTEYYWGALG